MIEILIDNNKLIITPIERVYKIQKMELLDEVYRDFAQSAINEGITPDTCMAYMYGLYSNFKNDKYFTDIFPIIFNIEYRNHMISKSSSKS